MEQRNQQPIQEKTENNLPIFFKRKGYQSRRERIVDFFGGLVGMYFFYFVWGFIGSISFIADPFPNFLDFTFWFVVGFHFLALFYFWKRRREFLSWGVFTSGFIPILWAWGMPFYLGILLGIVDWLFLPSH